MPNASPKRKRGQFAPTETFENVSQAVWPILKSDIEDSRRSSVTGKLGDLSLHCVNPHSTPGEDVPEPKRRAVASIPATDPPSFVQASSSVETTDRALPSHLVDPYSELDGIQRGSSVDANRPGSPTLSEEVNELYWSDKEITGYNPVDPTDDGYGINGIGFRPTPAMAYQRSQRRKQQLAEYRTREAKEARQKRSERRLRASASSDLSRDGSEPGPQRTKVHFDDG
jgi:hypothetical protein